MDFLQKGKCNFLREAKNEFSSTLIDLVVLTSDTETVPNLLSSADSKAPERLEFLPQMEQTSG